jgi:hypothetical protein
VSCARQAAKGQISEEVGKRKRLESRVDELEKQVAFAMHVSFGESDTTNAGQETDKG